jgi:CheY-like chemotaxis protein
MKKRILVTDDEPNVRLSYCTVLEVEGYATEEANSAVTALEKLIAGRFDLAILDLRGSTKTSLPRSKTRKGSTNSLDAERARNPSR